MRNTICIVLLSICFAVKAQIPTSIAGNWINEKTNHWEYGFFEDFAIYDCGFWDYQSVNTKGNKTTIVLQQGNHTVQLEVNNTKEGVVSIKNGKQKKQEYQLMQKRYPAYKTKDTSSFPTPEFKQDSATVIGYYHNFDKIPEEFKERYGRNYFELSVPDFLTGEEDRLRTDIDSLGRFSITIPIINTQETFADWQRLSQRLILEPNDTIFLFADINDLYPRESDSSHEEFVFRDKQILFMGKNARVNNELIQYKELWLWVDRQKEVENGTLGMAFLQVLEDMYNQHTKHLNDYIAAYPAVSDKFILYKKEYMKYDFARDLMQHRFDLRRSENNRFEEGYMEYVDKNFPLYNKEVYTLLRDYSSFLTDYMGYADDENTKTVTTTLDMVAEALEKENQMTSEMREMIDGFNRLLQQVEAAQEDTLQQRQLVEAGTGLIESINSSTIIMGKMQELSMEAFLKMELSLIDSLLTEPILKEWWTASKYYGQIDHTRIPWSSTAINELKERITNPYLLEKLLSINDYYVNISKQTIANEASLKNVDHLKDIYDADEIFNKLIEPYKGKVIYIDFWGTWCGPCRENMKFAGAVEEALHGKDVIFMYFANNSPEQSWKNVIKEMNLTGENIVHYRLPDQQQSMLERKLSINSYPTYMIIDKEGNIVNTKAPSPKDKDGLIAEINRLLE